MFEDVEQSVDGKSEFGEEVVNGDYELVVDSQV